MIDPSERPGDHGDPTVDFIDRDRDRDQDDRDPLDRMAEEFAERCRRGEDPSIAEYEGRHPEAGGKVRKLLTAVAMMEQLRRGSRQARSAPERIGEFRIIRELGRGGMGVVYEAIQETLGRRVAVKAIHHIHLDPVRLERFRREAQAVARLHHTNIVPIFGFGEHDGLPYYAMQYIRGEGLDALLATWRGEGGSKPEARWRFAATLGVQVARALEYAHEQGVLHRDVKPANLLIDEHQSVWITDFGLAKLVGQDDLTASGDVVGTLRYLAPESLKGETDHRGDIYSLGLTLYEVLTLHQPYGDLGPSALLRQVSEGRPPRPRSLDPSIPRDLETIVLKATSREPDHRYATAGAMADDLQRFLEDRAITARRETPIERVWRWSRRNRTTAALVATAAGSLLLASIVGWAGYVGTTRALDRESKRLLEAQAANRKNEEFVAFTIELFDELLGKISPQVESTPPRPRRFDHLDGAHGPDGEPGRRRMMAGKPRMDGEGHPGMGRLDRDHKPMDDGGGGPGGPGGGKFGGPGGGPGGPRGLGGSLANTELLQSVLTFFERFARSNETNPKLQGEAAWAYFKVAMLNERLGQEADAEKAFGRALEIFEGLVKTYPNIPDYHTKLVRISTQVDPWSVPAATLPLVEARLGRVRTLVDRLAMAMPEDPVIRLAQARAQFKLASTWQLLDRPEVEEGYSRSIELFNAVLDREPTLDKARIDRADSEELLGTLLIARGRRGEGLALLEAAADDLQALGPQERSAPPALDRLESIGEAFAQAGAADRAAQMARLRDQIRQAPRQGGPPRRGFDPMD